ncbi:TetR/AcrR family transcriptional regulator [Streptomyces xiaopingdaonensis]|uniref:TetR/AcrR family transcriptional regulator n=1 Tax=Streptomyces xiaopingdaonensis TaxID=1565415 RepID=UPI00030604E2|nr:TetR family transcriptional regulator [Streptomyces xiaopingdaonensis]
MSEHRAQGPPAAKPGARRTLTERRKSATQLDIARAAAELFAERGPQATTAEEIAERAGVALRTFYRYFRNKQDAVGPLLASGGDRWRQLLGESGPLLPGAALRDALEGAVRGSLTPPGAVAEESLEVTRRLLAAAREDPALRSVWYRVNQESEEALAPVLSGLLGEEAEPLDVRLVASAATDAIRLALESWAEAPEAERRPAELAVRCLRELTAGLRLTRDKSPRREGG